WPAGVLGFAAGLPLAALSVLPLLLLPPRHRFAAMLLTHAVAALAAIAAQVVGELPRMAADWGMVLVALGVAVLFMKLFFREFAEQTMEIVYWPLYRFEIRGPGRIDCPSRGPTLVIANHAAFFDPLFLCKVLPLPRVRAMMISIMFDR